MFALIAAHPCAIFPSEILALGRQTLAMFRIEPTWWSRSRSPASQQGTSNRRIFLRRVFPHCDGPSPDLYREAPALPATEGSALLYAGRHNSLLRVES